ncbi:pyridoxal-phosphate-dependent aminotransferase family protein [Curtanaerobium respiraculi]|uniref:pyridoxal-phosphate-dependent aminotransferase family protein n=1 Tax=Curtanaerobium respiraculi TaxID=2949669 RepID=UPI0024B3B14D|nr:aminotransferase class V-fold PLP-dependent enzyme [Curtanaerobium respiraculi]
MSESQVLKVGSQSAPYFRTPEFSQTMLENERLMLRFLHAPKGSRCVFLTTSGTGAMESVVMNVLSADDKVLVVNGGSFGQRFVDLCALHGLEYLEIKVPFGHQIRAEQLGECTGQGFTALLVNMDETSSGTLYDMPLIAEFCQANGMLLVVDAISAFISDELDMTALSAAVVITGSQKALAVHPGIAVVALAPQAIEWVEKNPEKCLYLSLKQALSNGARGQTPFTPAVTTLLEINARLKSIEAAGGVEAEQAVIRGRARRFRTFIADYPFELVSESPSNTVTALHPLNVGARSINDTMKDEYGIWLCPNGGSLADEVFRVGHIGTISAQDTAALEAAFADMNKRGLL